MIKLALPNLHNQVKLIQIPDTHGMMSYTDYESDILKKNTRIY